MAALTVAHRGDPYLHRENTLPSLASAVRAGADAVEMDVRLTSDGIPVLLHDPTLKRLWGHAVAVADLSCERVRQLTGGGVPTLDEALGAVESARALLDLTLPESADAVLDSVRSCGAGTRTYLSVNSMVTAVLLPATLGCAAACSNNTTGPGLRRRSARARSPHPSSDVITCLIRV